MIYIVKHKPYQLPQVPDGYKPICVGGYSEPDAIDCRTGDNIERLNLKINELTALYWLWKNAEDPVIGVAHYRSYLTDGGHHILTMDQIEGILDKADVICHSITLPTTIAANAIKSGLGAGQQAFDLVRSRLPHGYEESFDRVMGSYTFQMCHMGIARREIFDAYCAWLFSFIIDAADAYKLQPYCQTQQKRAVGYVAETMLSVWLDKNELNIANVPMLRLDY